RYRAPQEDRWGRYWRYRGGVDRGRRGDAQALPPPRRLDCARASQYRLRGQNPAAQSRAHPGQAGRAVPTLLIALAALAPSKQRATTSIAGLQILFARRGVAGLGWHGAGRRRRVAFWRNSASPRAIVAQRPRGGDLEAFAVAAQRHRSRASPDLAVDDERGDQHIGLGRANHQHDGAADQQGADEPQRSFEEAEHDESGRA